MIDMTNLVVTIAIVASIPVVSIRGTNPAHVYSLQSSCNISVWPNSACVGAGGPTFTNDCDVRIIGFPYQFFRVMDLGPAIDLPQKN